jgi:aminotransferase
MSSPTTAQFAAIEALRNGDEDVKMMVEEYNRRRRYIMGGLKSIGIECFEPEGAFYIFPQIGQYGLSSDEFCDRLLHEKRCAIVPGTAFGAGGEGFARISYAYSINHITQALERIEAFVKTL